MTWHNPDDNTIYQPMCARAFKSQYNMQRYNISNLYVLVENIFDFLYLRRTELGKFQIHLSLCRVGCVFSNQHALAVRIRRIFLQHGRYLPINYRFWRINPKTHIYNRIIGNTSVQRRKTNLRNKLKLNLTCYRLLTEHSSIVRELFSIVQ